MNLKRRCSLNKGEEHGRKKEKEKGCKEKISSW
jgi:hypothetical protein